MGYSRRTSTTVKFSVSTKNDYFYKWITFAVKLDCKYKLSTVLLVCVRERRPGESVDEKKGERGLSLFFFFLLTWGIVLGREAWPAGPWAYAGLLRSAQRVHKKGYFYKYKRDCPVWIPWLNK
jgi:hypothetical protein